MTTKSSSKFPILAMTHSSITRAEFTDDNVNFSNDKFEQIVTRWSYLSNFRRIDISCLLRDDRDQLIALGTEIEYPVGMLIWVVTKISDQTVFWSILASQRCCNLFTVLSFITVVFYKKNVSFLRFSIYLFLICC